MKGIIVASMLVVTGMMLSGCIVVGIERKAPAPEVTVTPQIVVTQTSGDIATCAEIDAAGKLEFDNSRVAALNTIAARTNLTPAAQVHLSNTVFKKLSFDNSKMDVLRTLIRNPAFSNAAKQNILVNLNKLSFDNQRAEILRLINDRGELKN